MLANAYTTNEVNAAILGTILTELDLGLDLALVLSALLSLATDNAKELALDKLNASNFLGMYIYGITIGMDFQTIANIISSDTGIILNDLMSSNAFTGELGLNMLNIFDYIELGPELYSDKEFSNEGGVIYTKYLSLEELLKLAYNNLKSLEEKIKFLENLKIKEDTVLNNIIEKALEYVKQIDIINNDSTLVDVNGSKLLRYKRQIYLDLKKLSNGGEELRRQGQLLHINLGLETQYLRAINYIETLTSTVSDRKYANYREAKRQYELNIRENPNYKESEPSILSKKWVFNFHEFVYNESYRNAWIDIYGGIINTDKFINDEVYRKEILNVINFSQNEMYINYSRKLQSFQEKEKQEKFINEYLPSLKGAIKNNALNSLLENAKSSLNAAKVFFNILDTMQVPHFFSYLQAADMLHQSMMKTSAKYRAVYTLGRDAIHEIGAHSTDDKENILRRTELFVNRVMRDRFLVLLNYKILIPRGFEYFIEEGGKIIKVPNKSSNTTILLGTRAGNASFKALMETRIIPDLLKGVLKRIEGGKRSTAILNNKFIKSLSSIMYKQNPEYSITINTAPNINMSPRSDTDKALFEQIKYDFNQLRMFPEKYITGKIKHPTDSNKDIYAGYDLIELFWLYNQIAFDGRPGENTMTSIFTDLLDYKIIKLFRDFINDFDNNNDLRETISLSKMIREVTPKANVWTTKLKHFYYEDPKTGKLSYWSKAEKIKGNYGDADINLSNYGQIRGYMPTTLSYLNDEDLLNFVTTTNSLDILENSLEVSLGNSGVAKLEIAYGGVYKIVHQPLDAKGNPDVSLEREIEIPKDKRQFFKKLPTKIVVTANGIDIDYDKDEISRLVDNLINCG